MRLYPRSAISHEADEVGHDEDKERTEPSPAPLGVIQELYPNDKHKDKESERYTVSVSTREVTVLRPIQTAEE